MDDKDACAEEIQVSYDRKDYSTIFVRCSLEFVGSSYYWQTGEIKKVQGWILHLSVVITELNQVLDLVIPRLIQWKVTFKVVRDYATANWLLEGFFGFEQLGKLICVYPSDDNEALRIAKDLISLTTQFKGPDIPTDRHLGSIVYTRYGSFNPVMRVNSIGQEVNHIYDHKGNLIPDTYHIPFKLLPGVEWPFSEIVSPNSHTSKLLNRTYYPLFVIKSDTKGDVIKALYFKHFWQIKPCLIKQGRKNMLLDRDGRDIRDRLKWQYELYHELKRVIPLPEIFDYFEENGDSYLAMQFVKGISIGDWVQYLYKNRTWRDLSEKLQMKLLDQLLNIIGIINRLHMKGYVHRDITSGNFLIDKDKKIMLIDMELCWSIGEQKPSPPFRLGTYGYMSPQQLRAEKPTMNEDIYAIGSLMIVFLTNLQPTRFQIDSPINLKKHLTWLIGNEQIGELITNCLQNDIHERPALSEIEYSLNSFRKRLSAGQETEQKGCALSKVEDEILKENLQLGVNGLSYSMFLNSKGRWVSKIRKYETHKGMIQNEAALYMGWYVGMSGPLWIVALAARVGLEVSMLENMYESSWDYIKENQLGNVSKAQLGLFSGIAGTAFAVSEGLNAKLLEVENWIDRLSESFELRTTNLSLATGKSGQGIALLQCFNWLNSANSEILLQSCVNSIISLQKKDGSWPITALDCADQSNMFSLNFGVCGIICFLLSYLKKYPDLKVRNVVSCSLDWLISKYTIRNGLLKIKKSRKKKARSESAVGEGMIGILLVMIWAYEVLKEPKYKDIVEVNFRFYPPRPILPNFSFDTGLAGLGELFLEAHRVFGDFIWKERANWIAQLFSMTIKVDEHNLGYWIVDNVDVLTADFSTGISGILHFLLRHQFPLEISHPFFPK